MAKTHSTRQSTKQDKSRKRPEQSDSYGDGCEIGHKMAMHWLTLRQRGLAPIGFSNLQHYALDFIEAHTKARGPKRTYVRGQIVGFFSTIENPQECIAISEWRKNGGRS